MTDQNAQNRSGRRWMIWSTQESIDNGVFSVMAAIETFASVALALWVSNALETTKYLLFPLLMGLFLLLRCDDSVALGVTLFRKYEIHYFHNARNASPMITNRYRQASFWVLLFVVVAAASGISYYLSSPPQFIAGDTFLFLWGLFVGFSAFYIGIHLSILLCLSLNSRILNHHEVAFVVIPTVTLSSFFSYLNNYRAVTFGVAVALVTFPVLGVTLAYVSRVLSGVPIWGQSPSILPVSALIRFGATARYAHKGFWQIPSNYKRLVFSTSLMQAPEIVPGYHEEDDVFIFRKFYEQFKQAPLFSYDKLVFLSVMCVWFIPSCFYRFSLRSTFYVFFPFTYIGGELVDRR